MCAEGVTLTDATAIRTGCLISRAVDELRNPEAALWFPRPDGDDWRLATRADDFRALNGSAVDKLDRQITVVLNMSDIRDQVAEIVWNADGPFRDVADSLGWLASAGGVMPDDWRELRALEDVLARETREPRSMASKRRAA
jgi:hypothetical protein